MNSETQRKMGSGFSPSRSGVERADRKSMETKVSSVVEEKIEKSSKKDGYTRKNLYSRKKREMGSEFPYLRSKVEGSEIKSKKTKGSPVVDGKKPKKSKERSSSRQVGEEKMDKKSKKSKVDSPEVQFRIGLDMCSKRGDVMGAISLYESAPKEGIKLEQYHYTVILYLCSSAAVGVVRPAKSGSGSRSFGKVDLTTEVSSASTVDLGEMGDRGNMNFDRAKSNFPVSNNGLWIESGKRSDANSDTMESNSNHFLLELAKDDVNSSFNGKDQCTQLSNWFADPNPEFSVGLNTSRQGEDDSANIKDRNNNPEDCEIWVSEDIKKYALARGFEIYEKMCLEKIPLNEAALTSVARMAMSMGNGDMAFDMVKQMKPLGINPRLRSYGPALFTFCNSGAIEKAFAVEEHMLEHGVYPEEPELNALLRLSISAGKGDKVYYLLHKLRTSARQVSLPTADLIERWFKSSAASRIGKRKWDRKVVMEAMENGGGGWHGQGWLGKGKWTVAHTFVGADGVCEGCGEKLVTIDLDPIETENFAKSVASIAAKRERNSSFQKFQKWLDYYGPFEAVVDAANVGLFSQKRFLLSKASYLGDMFGTSINAVVNGIRQKLPSKKWPLIVVHNKRIIGGKMDEPANRTLIEKWKNGDALYATPTGSNDDWYWLYAAIKFKCLIVTNDEMRDHIFQLLGNVFFPKWKERHHCGIVLTRHLSDLWKVHFSFGDNGPEFHMPPPCSVVIQESEMGHWHIPIASEHDSERERTWLCVTRADSLVGRRDSSTRSKESHSLHQNEGRSNSDAQSRHQMKLPPLNHGNVEESHQNTQYPPQEIYRSIRNIISTSVLSNHRTILSEIEAAEKLGSCIIDFQI
ncbi:hypothetical protein HHK36_014113 [Tetracentron sinense]|uniref:ribonuclease P n=1 Tax=Tetracentron sinense TaxID=13715 RepID=A0A834Z875_TETSI|nr:hypothetical protein HHK36_014113 [Tetracentron sinense]